MYIRLLSLIGLVCILGCASQHRMDFPPIVTESGTADAPDSGSVNVTLVFPGLGRECRVSELWGHEWLNELYEYTIRCSCFVDTGSIGKLLGKPVTVVITGCGAPQQYINGILTSARIELDTKPVLHLTIAPWLANLKRTAGFGMFVNRNAPEMVREVLGRYSYTDFEMDLRDSCPRKPLCIQYRETDLNFICRILEDAGIRFYFRQEATRAVLVMTDTTGPEAFHTSARLLSCSHSRKVDRYALGERNFGGHSLHATAGARESPFEMYDFPGGFRDSAEAAWYARIRLEELQCRDEVCEGSISNGFPHAGDRVQARDGSTQHLVTSTNATMSMDKGPGRLISHTFNAVPVSAHFRPERRTIWPTIGVQGAVVRGPRAGRVFRDSLGRIPVRFHWQRAEDTLCVWAPVAQSIPQTPGAGDEVLVTFRDGEIYDPVVTAVVRRRADRGRF